MRCLAILANAFRRLEALVAPDQSTGEPELDADATPSPEPEAADNTPLRAQLTSRQVEVLRHLADGLKPAEIAIVLSVSEGTVRAHIRDATARLEVKGSIAAINAARRLRLM